MKDSAHGHQCDSIVFWGEQTELPFIVMSKGTFKGHNNCEKIYQVQIWLWLKFLYKIGNHNSTFDPYFVDININELKEHFI